MKTIGLLGGMSWESTALYYRLINEETRRRLGGLHSAPLLLSSVDFAPVEQRRAYGPQGRRLQPHPFISYQMRDGVHPDRLAFWGEVAELRLTDALGLRGVPIPTTARGRLRVAGLSRKRDMLRTAGSISRLTAPHRAIITPTTKKRLLTSQTSPIRTAMR